MNHAIRTGLLAAALLTPLASPSAPAVAQEVEAPAATGLDAPLSLDPVATPELWQKAFAAHAEKAEKAEKAENPGNATAEDEKRGRRPPPPPSLPTFTGVATAGGRRYTYTMVGTNPQLRGAKSVVVPTLIIPVRLVFTDGSVLDPSVPNACLGGVKPLDLAVQSPLFVNFNYGEGPRQFVEQIRRLEFWHFTAPGQLNSGYSLRLAPSVLPALTIALPASDTTRQSACVTTGGVQRYGYVDIDNWFNYLQDQVAPLFPKLGVNASTFVLFLVNNVNFTENGIPVAISYHGALASQGAVVTYAASEIGAVQEGGKLISIEALSHEFAEWADDPYGDNPTPPWGHTGQVSGCQDNLEVGDPLSGTALPAVQMPSGYSYQPQETAFFSWFYDQAPSLGFDGWYSSGGTFRSPAAPCR